MPPSLVRLSALAAASSLLSSAATTMRMLLFLVPSYILQTAHSRANTGLVNLGGRSPRQVTHGIFHFPWHRHQIVETSGV